MIFIAALIDPSVLVWKRLVKRERSSLAPIGLKEAYKLTPVGLNSSQPHVYGRRQPQSPTPGILSQRRVIDALNPVGINLYKAEKSRLTTTH